MLFRGLVLTLATWAVSGQDVNFYSREKEAALGAGLAQEIRRHTTPVDSSEVQDYVARIGKNLAAQLTDTGLTWTFAVVQDSSGGRTHEPISLPGGFVFVSARLVLAAQDEAEFAGMLAHAMAHVSLRHGTRTATRGETANLATIPLIFMGGWAGAGDKEAAALVPAGFVKVQRAFEIEADRLAVQMMAGADYDPSELVRYIDRLQPASTDPPQARSALPPHDERIAALEQAIQGLPLKRFQRVQEEVRRLMPAPAETDQPPRMLRPPSLLKK